MPQPLLCLDEDVRHGAERFRSQFTKPHEPYVVTVLLGLMECEGRRTLSALLREVGAPSSVRGRSRCLAVAPWSTDTIVSSGQRHVRGERQPKVSAEREQRRQQQLSRRGRPTHPLVIGYLIEDDSTRSTPKGRNREGLGTHHSTTDDQRIVGHRVVQGRCVLLDRTGPLAPQWDRQANVCDRENVPLQSTIDLMEALIGEFEPVAGTKTHRLRESWSGATCAACGA
jgi:hypothetical protein